ncbi:MAG TPA: GNAT family N-acetyltransferase [Thermoanaerobaculia bacterium]|nr:GNAT family N-acetyltransferase [Thermoanaerobaculia bacterium]
MTAGRVRIRNARHDDRAFVVDAAGRLEEFGVPPGRTPGEIVAGERRTLLRYFAMPSDSEALLVAEGAGGERLGFAFLEAATDYFTGEAHGHVGILAVAREAEGTGAGKELLAAAEAWSRRRGYRRLTLNVFEANRHARDVYEHVGYAAETLRYVKPLD